MKEMKTWNWKQNPYLKKCQHFKTSLTEDVDRIQRNKLLKGETYKLRTNHGTWKDSLKMLLNICSLFQSANGCTPCLLDNDDCTEQKDW
jgi:hypothetical protein